MFFILSKVLYFLLFPISWIILLLIWRWRAKSATTRKRLLLLTVLIIVVFSNPFIYRSLMRAWQPAPVAISDTAHYSTGIVLGGLAYFDKNNRGFFSDAADRFIQTANLYHRGIIKKILVTGGTGNLLQREPPEAHFLKQEFINNGVNANDIIIEARSRNTHENAVFSKLILDSLHLVPPFVLITSAQHMPRSEAVFKKTGFNFITYPCDYRVADTRFSIGDTILPDITLFTGWGWFIKEIIGLGVYRLTGKA